MESEGLSVVMGEAAAEDQNLEPLFRCAWITLSLNSDLHFRRIDRRIRDGACERGDQLQCRRGCPP